MSAHMSADLLLLGRHVYAVQYVSTRSCWIKPQLCEDRTSISLHAYSPYCSLYIYRGTHQENLFINRELLKKSVAIYLNVWFRGDFFTEKLGASHSLESKGLSWNWILFIFTSFQEINSMQQYIDELQDKLGRWKSILHSSFFFTFLVV